MTNEDFLEWNAAVDRLAKEMRPTRLGPITAQTFMEEAEKMFKENGWNFQVYISVGESAYRARMPL